MWQEMVDLAIKQGIANNSLKNRKKIIIPTNGKGGIETLGNYRRITTLRKVHNWERNSQIEEESISIVRRSAMVHIKELWKEKNTLKIVERKNEYCKCDWKDVKAIKTQ